MAALPSLVVAAGVLYTLLLQATIPGEVFTVGDAGLKFLLTRQFSEGGWQVDLRLGGPPWVRALWDEGLYPFQPPLVVRRDGRYLVAYPFIFPLISAPLYRVLGYRGLYLLPLLATWAVWGLLWIACRRVGRSDLATAAALFSVALASPLTFYSATFWEHTLAVALALAGLVPILTPPEPGRAGAVSAGVLLGGAAWFREEMLVLAALTVALVALGRWRATRRLGVPLRHAGSVAAGLTAAVALFLALNVATYSHPLGLHSESAIAALRTDPRAAQRALSALRFLLSSLLAHLPVVVFPVLALMVLIRVRAAEVRLVSVLLALGAGFSLAVPVLLREAGGRQWGPRFLLVVVPLVSLACALAIDGLWHRAPRHLARTAAAVLAVLLAWGAYTNAWGAFQYLQRNYQRRMVPYRFVRDSEVRYVAVSHEVVAQQLAATFSGRTYFLADRAKDLRALAKAIREHDPDRLLYLCYPEYPCGPFQEAPPVVTFYDGRGRPFVQFRLRGRFDRYLIYEGAPVGG